MITINLLKNNKLYKETYIYLLDKLKYFYYRYFISDEKLLSRRFKKRLNRNLNLENPVLFNDKLQWLKLNWNDALADECADKYKVRKVVEQRIGKEYLNPLIGVYESPNQIDLERLPEKFVLKGTHGSGFNIICIDKSSIDWDEKVQVMNRWLRKNYYWQNREPVYKNIEPKIICEKFLDQDGGEELRDYRFFCFNGEPKFITVDLSITDKKKTRRNIYDLEWKMLDAEISYPKETKIDIPKPEKLDEMIELSKKLSSDFPHARVDFYYINKKIIFGEITFFHQSGMGVIKPVEFELQMGNWLTLPD